MLYEVITDELNIIPATFSKVLNMCDLPIVVLIAFFYAIRFASTYKFAVF